MYRRYCFIKLVISIEIYFCSSSSTNKITSSCNAIHAQVDASVVPDSTAAGGIRNAEDISKKELLPSATLMGTMQQTIECLVEKDVPPPCFRQQTSAFTTLEVELLHHKHIENTTPQSTITDIHHYLHRSIIAPVDLTCSTQLAVDTNTPVDQPNEIFSSPYTFQDAIKYNVITSPLPPAIFLHLHRFTYDVSAEQLHKVGSSIMLYTYMLCTHS